MIAAGSLTCDVAAMKSALGRVKSPALPVAYSNGGTLITAAGTDPRNASLRDRTQLCSECSRSPVLSSIVFRQATQAIQEA